MSWNDVAASLFASTKPHLRLIQRIRARYIGDHVLAGENRVYLFSGDIPKLIIWNELVAI